MNLCKKIFYFIISNFGPLVGFYFINFFWGFKTGVIVSIILVILEYSYLKIKKRQISHFFYFSSFIIIFFGFLDLYIQQPFFFKFEASVTNLFFCIYFAISLFKEKSIVQEFAELQNRTSPQQTLDKAFFFRFYTKIWCLYFLIKAIFYLWINFSSSFEASMIIRIFVGKISFWIMMFLSVGIPRQVWKLLEKFHLFPSQKKLNKLNDLLVHK